MRQCIRTKNIKPSTGLWLAPAVIVFLTLIGTCAAVKCYKCQVSPVIHKIDNQETKIPMCSKFDESDIYITECPYSTMCVKKTLRYYLQNGEIIDTVTRECASQKYTDQVLKQGAWRMEHKVEEPYKEGCEEFKENNLAGSTTTFCYCRGNLCNSAKKNDPTNGLHADAMAVIFVFNVMKYLSSGFYRL